MSDRGKQRARAGMARSAAKPAPTGAGAEPARPRETLASSLLMSHGLRRIAFAAAALFSATLHAAAFVACLTWSKPSSFGAVELSTEVVSIELTPSRVLEAQPKMERQEPAASTASVAPVEGNADDNIKPQREREKQQAEEPTPEPPIDPPKVETEPAAALPEEPQKAIADAEALPAGPVTEKEKPQIEKPAKPEPKQEAKPKEERKKEEKEEAEKRDARQKGGVTSRARSGKGTGRARASASRGSSLRYASYVRARVAANKPRGQGYRGSVVVAFGVTGSGGLSYVRIRRSSGSAALDRLALGAVRGAAPFPPPPPGAPRQFSIPYTFH